MNSLTEESFAPILHNKDLTFNSSISHYYNVLEHFPWYPSFSVYVYEICRESIPK